MPFVTTKNINIHSGKIKNKGIQAYHYNKTQMNAGT